MYSQERVEEILKILQEELRTSQKLQYMHPYCSTSYYISFKIRTIEQKSGIVNESQVFRGKECRDIFQ